MATTKRMEGLAPTGLTPLYFIAWDTTGLFCDNADGDFRFPPASYLLPTLEIGATGVYYRDENRINWGTRIVNYILVNAAGVIYATDGHIETYNDVVLDDVFNIQYAASIKKLVAQILSKLIGV